MVRASPAGSVANRVVPLLAALWWSAAGLGCGAQRDDPAARWERARRLWEEGSPRAHEVWSSIGPDSDPGREAHRRLREADGHYREGIRRLGEGKPGVRESLRRGLRTAPMDPKLYLPLARTCRDRDLVRYADEYYHKFLAANPDGPRARAARRELRALEPKLPGAFRPPDAPGPETARRSNGWGSTASAIGGAGGVLVLVALVGSIVWWRRRSTTLVHLAARRPEFHPTIAYVVGSLRHELLKHRVGAARDAVEALRRGRATSAQLALVRDRLGGPRSIRDAWMRHAGEIQRALRGEVALWRDPAFREARRAVCVLDRFAPRVGELRPRQVDRLAAAHARLCRFDRELAGFLSALVRTRVDDALLRQVVDEVRDEHTAGSVELDELRIASDKEPAVVEVFRIDLVLILKNLVRNAIVAVGRETQPRRVALEASTCIEATGEEIVQLHVRDTSRERLPADALLLGRMQHGLGLVATAVTRYGGTIDVDSGGPGWAKNVIVRFFRADDQDEDLFEADGMSAGSQANRAA